MACKQAQCYEFLMDKERFPKKYNTMLGDEGVQLSGGQK